LTRFIALALAAAVVLPPAALAAAGAEAFTSGSAAKPATEEEARTWSEAKDLRHIIVQSGLVYKDPALTAYVQHVVDRLYPEFKGSMRVTLLKSPDLNAFAVPDGDIYVNVGLLARFENEAQLATVLAHEGTHFTNRHGYLSEENLKNDAAFATFGALLGVPILPQLIAVSSMFGYSRELETEADQVGYQRLLQAGYDVREARSKGRGHPGALLLLDPSKAQGTPRQHDQALVPCRGWRGWERPRRVLAGDAAGTHRHSREHAVDGSCEAGPDHPGG
jgi:predicted Zn-dependent protease